MRCRADFSLWLKADPEWPLLLLYTCIHARTSPAFLIFSLPADTRPLKNYEMYIIYTYTYTYERAVLAAQLSIELSALAYLMRESRFVWPTGRAGIAASNYRFIRKILSDGISCNVRD